LAGEVPADEAHVRSAGNDVSGIFPAEIGICAVGLHPEAETDENSATGTGASIFTGLETGGGHRLGSSAGEKKRDQTYDRSTHASLHPHLLFDPIRYSQLSLDSERYFSRSSTQHDVAFQAPLGHVIWLPTARPSVWQAGNNGSE
jgi:hypothetical protein